jgi:hypothetical protein
VGPPLTPQTKRRPCGKEGSIGSGHAAAKQSDRKKMLTEMRSRKKLESNSNIFPTAAYFPTWSNKLLWQ